MAQKIQKYTRSTYYHLPLYCSLCSQLIVPDEESDEGFSPCKHTLYISHSEGHEYLSDRVKKQLSDKGYEFGNDDFFDTINLISDEEEQILPYELSEFLEFDDGIETELAVGAPSGMSVYVGIAPLKDE